MGGRLVADGDGGRRRGCGRARRRASWTPARSCWPRPWGRGCRTVRPSRPRRRPGSRSANHPPTRTTTSAATARRTQKPRSGSGVPVPGTVCRPTGRRYCLLASRRRNQPTTPTTSDPTMKTPATAYDACFKRRLRGCVVAEHRQPDGPGQGADHVGRQEPAVRHLAGAGDHRREGAHPGDPARDHHRPPAPALVERLGTEQVPLVQPAAGHLALQPAAAEPGPEGVADRVAGDGGHEGAGGEQRQGHPGIGLGGDQPGAEQDGVAGQEEADQQPGLDEHEAEHHGVHGAGPERAEVRREVREDVEHRGHPGSLGLAGCRTAMSRRGAWSRPVTSAGDEVGVGPWPGDWPDDPHYDPELLEHGDRRNVVDRYRYWSREAVVADLDTRRHEFHVAVENWQHDFNIGSVVRTANAFLAREVHIVGRRRWNRRGAMVTDRYQHVRHHPDLDVVRGLGRGRAAAGRRRRQPARLAAAGADPAAAGLRAAVRPGGPGAVRGGPGTADARGLGRAVRLDPVDQRRRRSRCRHAHLGPPARRSATPSDRASSGAMGIAGTALARYHSPERGQRGGKRSTRTAVLGSRHATRHRRRAARGLRHPDPSRRRGAARLPARADRRPGPHAADHAHRRGRGLGRRRVLERPRRVERRRGDRGSGRVVQSARPRVRVEALRVRPAGRPPGPVARGRLRAGRGGGAHRRGGRPRCATGWPSAADPEGITVRRLREDAAGAAEDWAGDQRR